MAAAAVSGGWTQCSTALEKMASNSASNGRAQTSWVSNAEAREILTGLGDHGGGAIDAEHLCAGSGDLRSQVTGAAADIEDALAGLGGEQGQKVAAEFPDEGVGGVVESGIPVSLHLPIVLRWQVHEAG